MIIKNVLIQNFMSIRELYIDFMQYDGITLIEGQNGVGKSSILDAITWCLTNKLLRNVPSVDSVTNRFHPEDRTFVRMELTTFSNRDLVVERSRYKGSPKLYVEGLDTDKGTTKGIQDVLTAAIGMDYSLFTSSIMFGGTVSSFCAMSDTEKKRILEEMLDFDYFLKAQKLANARLKEVEQEQYSVRIKLDSLIESRNSDISLLKETQEDADAYQSRFEEELKRLVDENADANMAVTEALKTYLNRCRDYDVVASEYNEAITGWNEKRDTLKALVVESQGKLSKAEQQYTAAMTLSREAKSRIDELKKDEHSDVCPTCGQRWPQDDTSAIEQLRATYVEKYDELEEKRIKAIRVREKISKETEDVVNKYEKFVSDKLRDPGSQDRFVEDEESDLKDAIRHHNLTQLLCKKCYEQQKNPHLNQCVILQKRIEKADAAIQEIQESMCTYTEKIAVYGYWSKGFGKNGIPSYLLDSAIPVLNESAHEISHALTDGELTVSFDPAVEKASSTIFDVYVDYVNGADSYGLCSRGEHSRVDLVSLFAIRELLAKRKQVKCSQVFVDEVFDGLDASGIQSVMKLLRSKYSDVNFFIVSHDEEMKGYADHVISLTKHVNGTTVCS